MADMAAPVPVLRDENGDVIYEFPATFRLERFPLSRTVPNTELSGRDGAATNRVMAREDPRPIRISGILYGPNLEEDRDQLLRYLNNKVYIGRQGKDRYIIADLTSANMPFVQGTNYQVMRVALNFRADDPFWYHIHEYKFSFSQYWIMIPPVIPESKMQIEKGDSLYINNIGNVPGKAIVTMKAVEDSVSNITLENLKTGLTLHYIGELSTEESVVFNSEDYTVTKDEQNFISQSGTGFLLHGFLIEPGENEIVADWDGEGHIELEIRYKLRWY